MTIYNSSLDIAVFEAIKNRTSTFETDESGQIVIYTGLYRWRDGSIHQEEESTSCKDQSDPLEEMRQADYRRHHSSY